MVPVINRVATNLVLFSSVLLVMSGLCLAAGTINITYPVNGTYYQNVTEFNGTLTLEEDPAYVDVWYFLQRTNDSYYYNDDTLEWASELRQNLIVTYNSPVVGVTYNWSTTDLPTFVEGITYSLTVRSEDNQSNILEYGPILFNADNVVPEANFSNAPTYPDNYANISGVFMTFARGTQNVTGYVNDTDLVNWTLNLYHNDLFNQTLCNGTTSGNFSCLWNTSEVCPESECENFTLILNATDLAGNYNDSSRVINNTIDNLDPVIGQDASIIWPGNNANVTLRVNISDTYLHMVNAYLLNESNHTVVKWSGLFNETQGEDAQIPGSGTFNVTWFKDTYSLNGTQVPVYWGYSPDCLVVPGCFAANGTDFDCGCRGDNCDEEYELYLVYNNSLDDAEPKPLLGIGSELWCENDNCTINSTIIDNGTSRFIPQLGSFHPIAGDEEGEPWNYTNLTSIILYNTSGDLNENLTRGNASGNYSFMFMAHDHVVMTNQLYEPFNSSGPAGIAFNVTFGLLNESTIYEGNTIPVLLNLTNTGQTNITRILISNRDDLNITYTSASIAPNETDWLNNLTSWNVSLTLQPNSTWLLYVNFTAVGFATNNSDWINITAVDEENNTAILSTGIYDFPILEDNTSPEVSFSRTSPTGTIYVGDTIVWSCTGTDVGSGNLTGTVTNGASTSITGTKVATCTVTDDAGNSNSTNLSYTVSSRPSSGSGGSYTPSYWKRTYTVSDADFEKGYLKSLLVRHRLKVSVDGETHYVGVVNTTNTTATINVSSTPQQAIFSVGDEKMFELTGDDYYDILVGLESLEDGTANVTVRSIHERMKDSITVGSCVNGERSCDGATLMECVGGNWTTLEVCELGCDSDLLTCDNHTQTVNPVCIENGRRCLGDELQKCGSGIWQTIDICQYGCDPRMLECMEGPSSDGSGTTGSTARLLILVFILLALGVIYLSKSKVYW